MLSLLRDLKTKDFYDSPQKKKLSGVSFFLEKLVQVH